MKTPENLRPSADDRAETAAAEQHDHECACDEYRDVVSRRRFMSRGKFLAAAMASSPVWLPKVALNASSGGGRDILLNVFLRGGMDGLTFVPPYQENLLYALRPNLGVLPPGQPNGAHDLDGFFGLLPAAGPLLTPYNAGHLAFIHACGSTDPTLSHFDAMKAWEFGIPNQSLQFATTGWLAKHLQEVNGAPNAPLRGLALESAVPQAMARAPKTLPIANPAAYDFPGLSTTRNARRTRMSNMYQGAPSPLGAAALDTFQTIDLLDSINFDSYMPENGAVYPTSPFGTKLRQSAALIKADVGLEAISIDVGGWDHHADQGPLNGIMSILAADVANAVEAFYLDTLAKKDCLVMIIQTEFGRRAAENGSAGTDHGHGGVMMVMGGQINGGQVMTNPWPTLNNLNPNGDLRTTTDYRDILGEILSKRMGNNNLSAVFPNHNFKTHNIVR